MVHRSWQYKVYLSGYRLQKTIWGSTSDQKRMPSNSIASPDLNHCNYYNEVLQGTGFPSPDESHLNSKHLVLKQHTKIDFQTLSLLTVRLLQILHWNNMKHKLAVLPTSNHPQSNLIQPPICLNCRASLDMNTFLTVGHTLLINSALNQNR